jgi:hypothetical protein
MTKIVKNYEYGNSGGGIMLLTQKTKDDKYWISVSDAGGVVINDFNYWEDDGDRDYEKSSVLNLGDFDLWIIPHEILTRIEQSEYSDEIYQAINNFLAEKSKGKVLDFTD